MVTVRRAGMEDLPALNHLETVCFSLPWSDNTLREMLESPLDTVWAAVTPNRRTAAYLDYREVAGEGELMRVCVDPAFRGHGVASRILETITSHLKNLGIDWIVCISVPGVEKLYLKLGETMDRHTPIRFH